MEIKISTAAHEGGTKFYKVIQVSKPHQSGGWVIFNYGPNGKLGQIDASVQNSTWLMNTAFNKKVIEKSKRGYSFSAPASLSTGHLDGKEILQELTRLMRGHNSYSDFVRFTSQDDAVSVTVHDAPSAKVEPTIDRTADATWGTW